MPPTRLRALVLAAGSRYPVAPRSRSQTPKPLLPVVGIPILGHTLAELARLANPACEAIAVNLHYQGEQIRSYFGESFAGIPLTYSEEPVLLGTGGAFGPAPRVLRVGRSDPSGQRR